MKETNRAVIVMATGEYNQFIEKLIASTRYFFGANIYLFTDQPEDYAGQEGVIIVKIPHLGWPRMPLLRFELINHCKNIFKENYLFLLDSEAEFMRPVGNGVLDHRVATLHRNIMRFRDEYNYETRKASTAYVSPKEGENYYACGFVGGSRKEFLRMAEVISANIRTDIRNGIRARWGDESHLNRYMIDNRPSLVLPPNYMCPSTNPYFIPYIMHRDKKFKRINNPDTEKYLEIDPKDYDVNWDEILKEL